VFGLEDLQAEPFPAPELRGTAPGAEPWLYLGPDSPNRDYILKELQADPFLLPEPEEAAPGVKPWLYVDVDGPDSDYLCNHVMAWGGRVMGPVKVALVAAQLASREDLAGAILQVDWNVEASLVICDVLMRRGIPFIAIAWEVEFPPAMALGGVILRGRNWIDEIRSALDSVPPRATAGMDLLREVSIEWG
jgi:hypothetical protein